MCRYFLNGNCRYGDFCRNPHVIQQEGTATSEPNAANLDQKDLNNNGNSHTDTPPEQTRNWIDAPEFIPRYAIHNTNGTSQSNTEQQQQQQQQEGASR